MQIKKYGTLIAAALTLTAYTPGCTEAKTIVVDAAGNCPLSEALQFVQEFTVETKCVNIGSNDANTTIILNTDVAFNGWPGVHDVHITIEGRGHTVTGVSTSNVFTVYNRSLTLNNLTVTGGDRGISVQGPSGVILNNSTVSGNAAEGIVSLDGSVTLNNSTVSNNGTIGISTGFSSVTLNNATVSGNSVGIYVYKTSFYMQGSLVSGNSGFDIEHAITTWPASNIFNVLGDSSKTNAQAFSGTAVPDSTNIIATSDGTKPTALAAILSPLADNGGPTKTHALPVGSPAIDLDANCNAQLTVDQRRYTRPVGLGCDAGAFEFGGIPAVLKNINMAPVYNMLL